MLSFLCRALLLLLVLAVAAPALAQVKKLPPPAEDPPPPPPKDPPPPPPRDATTAPPKRTQPAPSQPQQPRQPQPGDYARDGFYMGFSGGGAYIQDTFIDDPTGSGFFMWDLGFMGGISMGYTVVDRYLNVHVDLYGAAGPSACVYIDDVLQESAAPPIQIGMVGAGLTWYFLVHPDGALYLSGSIGGAIFAYDLGEPESTEIGLGTTAAIGHDWWISENWYVGLSTRAIYALTEGESGELHNTLAVGLLFGIGYN